MPISAADSAFCDALLAFVLAFVAQGAGQDLVDKFLAILSKIPDASTTMMLTRSADMVKILSAKSNTNPTMPFALSAVDSLAEKHFQSTASPKTVEPVELPARTDSNRSSVGSPSMSPQSWADQDDEEKTPEPKVYRTLSDVVKNKVAENVKTDEVKVPGKVVQNPNRNIPDGYVRIKSVILVNHTEYGNSEVKTISKLLGSFRNENDGYFTFYLNIKNVPLFHEVEENKFDFVIQVPGNRLGYHSQILFGTFERGSDQCIKTAKIIGRIPDQVREVDTFESLFEKLQDAVWETYGHNMEYVVPESIPKPDRVFTKISDFVVKFVKDSIRENQLISGPIGSFDHLRKEWIEAQKKPEEFPVLVSAEVSPAK